METICLLEPYLCIKCGDTALYGGSQELLRGENPLLADLGCGIIAACDMLIYSGLTEYNPEKITKEEYLRFLRRYSSDYAKIRRSLDTNGFKLAAAVRSFTCGRLKLHWNVGITLRRKFPDRLGYIKRSISAGMPVIIAVGPRVKGVPLYTDSSLQNRFGTDFLDHYAVVTGVFSSENKTVLSVSSWGRRLYLEWGEYVRGTVSTHRSLIIRTIYGAFSDIFVIVGRLPISLNPLRQTCASMDNR